MAKPPIPNGLTEEDFVGFDKKDLECLQCLGVFCPSRVCRLLDGKPFFMCGDKESVNEFLKKSDRKPLD